MPARMLPHSDGQWLPVVGYEGYYEVSDHGCVRSVERTVPQRGKKPRTFPSIVLKFGSRHPFGYVTVNLCRDNRSRTVTVHSLVLEAFTGPRPEGMWGLHGDDDPSNNHLSNLRWGSPKDNSRDMVSRGRRFDPYAERTACGRGHGLVTPNLRGRYCLACYRADTFRNNARRDGRSVPNMQDLSDQKYREIMSTCR